MTRTTSHPGQLELIPRTSHRREALPAYRVPARRRDGFAASWRCPAGPDHLRFFLTIDWGFAAVPTAEQFRSLWVMSFPQLFLSTRQLAEWSERLRERSRDLQRKSYNRGEWAKARALLRETQKRVALTAHDKARSRRRLAAGVYECTPSEIAPQETTHSVEPLPFPRTSRCNIKRHNPPPLAQQD